MTTEVRMTIRIPKEADRYLGKEAKAHFTSKNAQIVRVIRDAMNAKGPAATAIAPDHDQNHNPSKDGGIDVRT